MLPGQSMGRRRARQVADAAGRLRRARQGVGFPRWYLRRWHFLPEGYLSDRSVLLYERAVRAFYNAGMEPRVRSAVVAELVGSGARRVLEVGCGPGLLLRDLARALPETQLTGVDLSPHMLERAGARLPASIELLHADACDLPFEDDRFDAVIAVHVLGHVPDPVRDAVMAEIERVLAPGGRAYVADHPWHAESGWQHVRVVGRRALAARSVSLRVWAVDHVPGFHTRSASGHEGR